MEPTNNPAVKVLQVCQVVPSPDSASEFSLPLTFFDTFWFKFPPIQRIFYYELPDPTHNFFNSVVLPRLKQSLSLTLTHFLPLAGNLTWPAHAAKPVILYTPGDGVPFTVTESNDPDSFPRLSGKKARAAADSHPFVAELPVSDSSAAPVSIKVTFFAGHGFSVGLTSHHAILDGRSVAMFTECWARICKQLEDQPNFLPPDELKPSLDRTVVEDREGLDLKFLKSRTEISWGELDPNYNAKNTNPRSLKVLRALLPPRLNLVRATYEFCREDIKKLREMVISQLDGDIRLSSFVLSFTYTLVCIAKAKRLEGPTKFCALYMADCRAHSDSPIPDNYLGNCITHDAVIMEPEVMKGENGVAVMAERFCESIKGLRKGSVVEVAKEYLTNMLPLDIGGMLTIATGGSARFGFYDRDFGWGRPKLVEMTSIEKTGAVSLADSRDGSGGIEVGLVLEKQEMEVFDSVFVNGLKNL